MSNPIGVDLGATFTAAAMCLPERVEVTPLGARVAFIPTVAAVTRDGSLALGEDAAALSGSDRVARQFIRRVGDDTPLLFGGISVTAETLAAQFVSFVAGTVATRSGAPATRVAVTHPASWGSYRLAALRSALSARGFDAAVLLSGAQAAAQAYADRTPVAAGDLVAVYDLGGSGLDAAVVRRLASGEFALAGRAEEVEVGGLDFDELVFEHVRTALGEQWTALNARDPAVLAGVARLRRECTMAKERLSTDTDVWIPVAIPGVDAGSGGAVRLIRAELEEMIRPAVEETAEALLRAIDSAGVEPTDLAAVLLTGGSARIPLVTQVVSEMLGRPVVVADNPKADTAIGAALAAAGRIGAIADPPAVESALEGSTADQTRIMLRAVPDVADEPSTARASAPVPARPAALLAPPGSPVAGKRRRYAKSGLLAAGAAAIAGLLVGGWLTMANVSGPPPAGAEVNNAVPDQNGAPATATMESSPPAESRPATQPNTRRTPPSMRGTQPGPSTRPSRTTTGAPGPTPSAGRTGSPTAMPTRTVSSTPTPDTTQGPTPSTTQSPAARLAGGAPGTTEPGGNGS
jgi:actin-like ATPase involved in cell morphogenesis